MEIVFALLVCSLPAGLLMALGAPLMGSMTPRARHLYGGAVAALLVLWGGLATWLVLRANGASPWLVALISVPLAVAGLIVVAIRDERTRAGQGWVPTGVLAAFPALILAGVLALLAGVS